MTPDAQCLVRESFAKIEPNAATAAAMFYDRPIVPAVQDLGRRHAGHGVAPSHYQTVATALLWTLEQGLGDEFTPETRQAWLECYTSLASTMQKATETA